MCALTPFELGSITKTFTGLLLADAVERGELALDDQLAEHLPELRGTAAGGVTLKQLATHRSGLPGLPPAMVAGNLLKVIGNENPYAVSADAVIQASRTTELQEPGRYAYSNLGMSLLGHAEARAAGPCWRSTASAVRRLSCWAAARGGWTALVWPSRRPRTRCPRSIDPPDPGSRPWPRW